MGTMTAHAHRHAYDRRTGGETEGGGDTQKSRFDPTRQKMVKGNGGKALSARQQTQTSHSAKASNRSAHLSTQTLAGSGFNGDSCGGATGTSHRESDCTVESSV